MQYAAAAPGAGPLTAAGMQVITLRCLRHQFAPSALRSEKAAKRRPAAD
jgi:hypothetical protein